MLVFACISPHPPIILPQVGSPTDREKVKSTIGALASLAPKLAAARPEIIIISSPHPDWGINVPLHFLTKNLSLKLANTQGGATIPPRRWNSIDTSGRIDLFPILTTLESPKYHFNWGKTIVSHLSRKRRFAWIASGDMSHRLLAEGPYGFHPSGPKFDKKFIELLKKKDIKGILNLDPELVKQAGECGLRSFCILLGALEGSKVNWHPEILSHEGPFGVGYLVANIQINANPK